MASLMSRQQCLRASGSRPRPSAVRAPAAPAMSSAPRRAQRARAVAARAFFNFGGAKAAAPANTARRDELVDELLGVCARGGGASVPRDDVEELVAELAPLGVKNPLKSPLFWGDWEVAYCSNPAAVGGPLKKGAGPILFPGQRAVQRLSPPNELVNEVTFSALGFLRGYSRQYGEIKPLSGDTFVLEITRGELSTGVGGVQEREFDIQRRIKIEHLSDELRVARFLPSDDLADSEGAPDDEILFVFRRAAADGADDEEEEDDEEDAEAAAPSVVPKLNLPLFGGSGKGEGLATRAERQVKQQQQQQQQQQRQQQQQTRSGTGTRQVGGGTGTVAMRKPAAAGRAATRRGQQQRDEEPAETPAQRRAREQAEARAAAKAAADAKRAEQEREAAKQRAEQERAAAKQRAEQEREAAKQRQAAIREQLAELANELKEAQAAARDAAKEVADIRRSAGPTLKKVAAAEAAVEATARGSAGAAEALARLAEERRAAEAALKEAQAAAKDAEAALKRVRVTAGARR